MKQDCDSFNPRSGVPTKRVQRHAYFVHANPTTAAAGCRDWAGLLAPAQYAIASLQTTVKCCLVCFNVNGIAINAADCGYANYLLASRIGTA